MLVVTLAVLAPGGGLGQGDSTSPDLQDELEAARSRGALLFQIHCATCHGLQGRGDGPLADDLKVDPADLTTLIARDDAGNPAFPAQRLRDIIDGREEVRGHGSRDMPIWGLSFQDPGRAADQEEPVGGKIDDLLEFIETIQEPVDGD